MPVTKQINSNSNIKQLTDQETLGLAPYRAPTLQVFTQTAYYTFTITAATVGQGSVYSNNSSQFTVVYAVAGGTTVVAYLSSGTNAPTSTGTLTYVSGTPTGNLTFSAVAANGTYFPSSSSVLYAKVKMVGGGGGGAGAGQTSPGAGGTGGTTSLGTSVLSAAGGAGGLAENPQAFPTTTFTLSGSGVSGFVIEGSAGGSGAINNTTAYSISIYGGYGGSSPFGGAGAFIRGTGGIAAVPNSGSGGGGGSGYDTATWVSGGGGNAGLYLEALVSGSTLATWITSGAPFVVGVGGSKGAAGTGAGVQGGLGGSGIIIIEEHYQ